MLTDPGSRYAESIRMLRVRLALGTTELQPRLIMVTSANPREGKSTTVANLAVALAQAGRRVVLCDLDARRPTLDRLFKLPAQPGLTDVVIDNADLEDALTVVPIPPKPYWGRDGSRNGRARGVLEVLTLGHPPAEPGEFTGSERVAEILESLRGRADVVLIDTPAILSVGDAMTIAGIVDAVMVVARFQLMPRSRLKELARVLAAFPATPLGIVATGAAFGDRYRDDWYYQYPEALERTAGIDSALASSSWRRLSCRTDRRPPSSRAPDVAYANVERGGADPIKLADQICSRRLFDLRQQNSYTRSTAKRGELGLQGRGIPFSLLPDNEPRRDGDHRRCPWRGPTGAASERPEACLPCGFKPRSGTTAFEVVAQLGLRRIVDVDRCPPGVVLVRCIPVPASSRGTRGGSTACFTAGTTSADSDDSRDRDNLRLVSGGTRCATRAGHSFA